MLTRSRCLRRVDWSGVKLLESRVWHDELATNSFQPKMPGAQAQPVQCEQNSLSLAAIGPARWQTQLKGQDNFNRQRPRHYSQPHMSAPLLPAVSKAAESIDAVRAEFSMAAIPDYITTKVVKQYAPYCRWDIATKLRPALALWVKQLGSQQLSAQLEKAPQLLLRTPEECSDTYLWLASVGLGAERIQQRVPGVMARQLDQVQSTVWAIQHVLQLTDEKLPAFFWRHAESLKYSPERVALTLNTIAELLAVPVASQEFHDVLMLCDRQLFNRVPAVIHRRVTFFCDEFKGGQPAAMTALKQAVYRMSTESVTARAAKLKEMLGWTQDDLQKKLGTYPRILCLKSSTVASSIQKLQARHFTSVEASNLIASHPALSGFDWDASSNREKLAYLRHILQFSSAELATRPQLLASSLGRKLGPRSEFVCRSKAVSPDMVHGRSGYLHGISDAKFAARFNDLSASPPLIFDEDFKQHWRERWRFLTVEMGLSAADISACKALLFTSLTNTLAPRWHFLTVLEAAQADFKAAEHLAALATLSDEHFAQAFQLAHSGLIYNRNFV